MQKFQNSFSTSTLTCGRAYPVDATEPTRRGRHTNSARKPRNTTETMDGYAFSSCDLARLAEPQLETDPDTALPSEERIQKNIIQVAIPRLPA